MQTIRLILVDDHEVIRTGLKTFLQNQAGLQVIGEARNGHEAILLAHELKPDVIVMDLSMPDMDGLEATRRIVNDEPSSKILALTVHADKQYFFEMLAAGAAGYITKQAAAEELVAAIQAVAQGNVYLQPVLASWLLQDYRRLLAQSPQPRNAPGQEGKPGKGLDILSKRELQVLEMVAQGLSNQEIGENLAISPKTVARHRERIMGKLDIHSCAELVRFAIRSGLLRME